MASIVTGLIEQVKIDAGANQSIASTAYGVCNTLSDQAAKTVEMTGFKLITGVTVHIKFTYSNAAENPPTLNINNTGAKSIVQYGTTSTGTNAETNGWQAGAVLSLTYDGTSWVRDQGYNTNTNTWRGIQDNLTSDSATDSLSAKQGKALKGLIDAMDASTPAASGNATAFIDSITQADGKITSITKKNIPTISKDTAGLAPKGAAVSTQNTSTKFLREDGTWATPSYTTNVDTKVTQTGNTENKEFSILLKNTNNTSDETNGVKFGKTENKLVTVNPSTGRITAPGGLAGVADSANAVAWGNVSSKPTSIKLTGAVTGSVTLGSGENSITTTVNHTHAYLSSIAWDNSNKKITQSINGAAATAILEFVAGSNITLTPAAGKLTIANTYSYTLPLATYNVLGGLKPAYSSTNAVTLTTAAATNTDTPTIAAKTTTSGRYYAVEADKNGIAYVNVPWTDHYAWNDITSKPETATRWPTWNEVTSKPSTFAPSAHTHSYITSRGNVTNETGGNKPAQAGLSMSNAYNNGYPITYGNVLTMYGSGASQLLIGWSGSSSSSNGVREESYIRSQRDTAESLWSAWEKILTSGNTSAPSTVPTLAWNTEATIFTLGGTAVKIKAMAKPSYSWGDISSKPETATRWPKWNEIVAGADALNEGTSNWTDNTEILTSYASNNGFADTNAKGVVYRRDALCAYNYIKGKLDSVYAAKATTLSGYGITDAKIASGVITLGSNTITPVTSVNGHTGSSVNVTAADLGLSKAMHFIGVATVAITDGSTTDPVISGYSTKTAGDVIIDKDNSREYVWSTTGNWELLGGDSSYKVTQSAVDSGAAATNKWVSRIQQNANGVVTVTMGTLDTSGTWSGNASTATKATQDGSGNTITNKYFQIYNTNYQGNSSSVTVNDLASQGPAYGMIYSATDNPTGSATWVHVLNMGWNKANTSWIGQIALHTNGAVMYFRGNGNSAISGKGWNTVLSSNNYTSYTVKKDGTGATGSWGISITGSSASCTGLAAKATADGDGNVITTKYVTVDTAQTITGTKSWGTNGAGGQLYGAATNGGINSIRIGDDVWLGDCNSGGIMGIKANASSTTNCGFYFYNGSGTQIGQLYFNGTNLYCNKTIEHPDAAVSYIAGAKGSGAALYAKKTYNENHWYPAVALETKGGGAWQIGNYNDETLEFQYATKENRDSNTNSTSEIYMQQGDTGRVVTSGNYTNWTVTKTGSGASGTWGISVTGTASNVTGTVAVANGGTGATTAAEARTNLGTWSLISDSYNTLMPADGTTNGWIKIGKSNTSYGLLPSASGGAGSGHNYIGTSSWYWKYAYIDEIYGHLNGNAATATAFASGTTVKLTGDVIGESSSSTKGWSVATTIGAGKVTNNMLAGSITKDKLDTTIFKTFTRANMGTSPNFDNPGVVGLFEIRTTAETSGETGTKPVNGFYPILSMRSENVMLQLAGSNAVGFWIRGKQAASVTLSGVAWEKILTSNNYNDYAPTKTGGGASGSWEISVTGNADTATKLQTARTINGTNFDGSAAITTTNWGTARNISISDSDGTNTGTAVSVNGSAAVTLKLPSTIKASLTGNADTATTLQNARTIWGQSFNGSANITGVMTNMTGYSPNWSDVWSDGTNSHPWYGYDHRYPNTGVFSSTWSDYFGLTLKTASGYISMKSDGKVGIGTTTPSEKLSVDGWVGTIGNTGWYSITHKGGMWMSDANWIRTYNSKPMLIEIGTNNAWGIGTHRLALALTGSNHVSMLLNSGNVGYGFCVNTDGNWYFGRRTNGSVTSASNDVYLYYGNTNGILPYADNSRALGDSSRRWKTCYAVTFYGALSGNADTATKATQDSDGNAINSTYFKLTETRAATTSNTFSITNATASTSKTTGALKVKGGVGVEGSIYADQVYNAVWNDYAEYRKCDELAPGMCVQENDDGKLTASNHRLIPACSIITDTFGFSEGETDDAKTPVAVAGRVLAYTYLPRHMYHAGMAVCSAPGGTIDAMTREEIREYPDCIIGYVSEIPDYEEWGSGNVKVNGRIWIKVK